MTSPADVVSAVAPPVDDRFTLRGWIPVSERLPEDTPSGCVLVFYRRDRLADYLPQEQVVNTTWVNGIGRHNVTHWMPLPAPPEANRGAPAGATAQTPPKDQS
jgi:hypothetical protein